MSQQIQNGYLCSTTNPMEEHKVISIVIASGYDVRNEKQLEAAIEVLKKESAKLGAHAVIILPNGS